MTNGTYWQEQGEVTLNWSISDGFNGYYWTDPSAAVDAIQAALTTFSQYANLSFNFVGSFTDTGDDPTDAAAAGSELNFSRSSTGDRFDSDNVYAYGHFPFEHGGSPYEGAAGDIYLNTDSPAKDWPYDAGSAGRSLLLHEIGHTLGLKHPHDDGGTDSLFPTFTELGIKENDYERFTVMSYRDERSDVDAYNAASPMLIDVVGLQYLYGLDWSQNDGATTHQVRANDQYQTVWDAGGTDAVDASGAGEGWVIKLPDTVISSEVSQLWGRAEPNSSADGDVPTTLYWLEGDIENAFGSAYADELVGNALDNSLLGRGGNDSIQYGGGQDIVQGGAGRDTMDFSEAGEAVWARLGYGGFYEAWTRDGAQGDVDSGNWSVIASVDGVENLIGSAYDDSLAGTAGDNTISGVGGDDTIAYVGGVDTVDGGYGRDTMDFSGAGEAVWAHLGYGGFYEAWTRDGAQGDVDSGNWFAIASVEGIENLIGSAYDDSLAGTAGDNTIWGVGGDDTITYRGGVDTVEGGAGRDTMDFSGAGEAVWARLGYDGFYEAWTRDGAQGDVDSGSWFATASVDGVENLIGSAYDDDLAGNALNNMIAGVGGDDTIAYQGGVEYGRRRRRPDAMDFSGAGEAVWARLGYDGFYEAWTRDGAQGDVDSGSWFAIASVDGVENLIGSAYDDDLAGDGNANRLNGLAGDDRLAGLGGNDRVVYGDGLDSVYGGSGQDAMDFSETGEAVWAHLGYGGAYQAWTRDGATGDVDSGSWFAIASVDGVENLTGSSYDDDLAGDGNANRLNGRAGDDRLQGKGGEDTFVFEPGADSDVIADWQDGRDTLDLTALNFADFDAVNNNATTVDGDLELTLGNDAFVEILGFSKSNFDDTDVVV
ncbi:MAG: matrixin family metalloprotease [Rhodovibrio sp.]|nr:matrixin family metalloprotease [Rhodovibrio sp.]